MSNPVNQPPPDDQGELSHADDSVIGAAFKRSGFILAAIALVVTGGVWWKQRKPAAAPAQVTPISSPAAATRPAAEAPVARFVDVTAASGIGFRRHNGAAGDKLLPETMGGGVAFLDYDGDGDADLLFVNGADWPWNKSPRRPAPTMALYRNDGLGHFEDVTQGSGLDVSLQGMAPAVGDFDNDGKVDLFVTGVGGNRLFHNLGGGKFADVTASAGVAGPADGWSTCAAWLDYDNDGRLDLFVGYYVKWSKQIDLEVG